MILSQKVSKTLKIVSWTFMKYFLPLQDLLMGIGHITFLLHTNPGGQIDVHLNKGIRDAGSTADFRILFEIFEILEIFNFF